MIILEHLTKKERDFLINNLSQKQKDFITYFLKRGKKTVFANVLAKGKAGSYDQQTIDDIAHQWELLDYIDAGDNWRQDSQLFCECGRQLRYQYIIQNLLTDEIKKFGIEHFEQHTEISPQLAKDIKKGFEEIDYELDEVLLKIKHGWSLKEEGIFNISSSIEIPKDIQQHLESDIPLLTRQVRRLKEVLQAFQKEKENEYIKELKQKKEEKSLKYKEKVRILQDIFSNNLQLEERFQLGIMAYINDLKNSQFTASEVCNELVEYYGASNATYPTGRFMIFPNVSFYLDSLCKQRILDFIGKQGVERLYKVVE